MKVPSKLLVATPLTNVRYVDRTLGDDIYGNGSSLKPYQTIQAALTAIGPAASTADVKVPCEVYITGGNYDESLTIPAGRIMTLIGMGTVILGNGAGTNWSSTVPRSITCTFNNASVFGSDIKPALTLKTEPLSDATSTFIAESGMFRVSGDINVSGDGLSHTLNFHGARIDGVITKTAAGLTNFQSYRSHFVGAINMGTATIFERIEDSQFDALITIDGYNAFIGSEIRAGLTCATNFNTLPPSGLFYTTFTGVFTAPANGVKLDPTSYYFFKTNGATLGGAATIVRLSDAEGIAYTPTTPADWSVVPTQIRAALDSLAASGALAATSLNIPGTIVKRDGAGGFQAGIIKLLSDTIQFGTVDAFARNQIWNFMASSVLRLGAWQADGDATSVSSEGIVVYGNSLLGAAISPAAGSYARVKNDRFGLFDIDASLPFYAGGAYYYRVDPTELVYRDNAGNKVFSIIRATGAAIIRGALNMSASLINNVADPVSAQDAATKNYVDTKTVIGTTTLAGGTVSVSFPSIAAADGVFLTVVGLPGVVATYGVTINAGVGFDIFSTTGGDTSTLKYVVIKT